MERITNTVTGIFGARGTGKTPLILGAPEHNIKGLVKTYLEKDMKLLIVDTFDHPSYSSIKLIKPSQIPKLKSGAARVFVRPDQMPELNKIINESIYNTCIIYEDAYKHQQEKLDKSIMCLIGDSKQKNVDIVFMYHCYALAPVDLYRYLDYLEIYKTKDSPEERKTAMRGYFKEAMQVYDEVMANPSRYFHKTLYTGL
jgi:hypothetical protein